MRIRNTNPEFVSSLYMINEARFWSKVLRGDSCWLWTGKKSRDGYGRCKVDGRQVQAHRLSWLITHGYLPDAKRGKDGGLYVCHTCDNKGCVNPAHLFLGSQKNNMQDASVKGRIVVNAPKIRGVLNGSARLTEDQVVEIRRVLATGRGHSARLAETYGVSKSNIYAIANRESWRHV